MLILLLIIGVFLGYLLQRALYGRYWSAGLTVTAEFTDKYAYEGDISYLREEIVNDKLLPLPVLEVNMAMNRALLFTGDAKENANVTDRTYRRDIFSLFARQKAIRRLAFTCKKRGYYEINEAGIIGHDFFFQNSYHGSRPQKSSMYVYPKPVDTRRIAPVCRALSGMILTRNRLYPDPFAFAGIREYRPTDPIQSINWKASAKGMGLRVNQFDSTTNIQLRLILDTEDSGIFREEELTEEGIRIAASLAYRIVNEKMDVKVSGNGIEPEVLRAGSAHMSDLYRKLALIDLAKEMPRLEELIALETEHIDEGDVFAIISMNRDERTVKAVSKLAAKGNSVLWVCPVRIRTLRDEKMPSVKGVRFISWEVA